MEGVPRVEELCVRVEDANVFREPREKLVYAEWDFPCVPHFSAYLLSCISAFLLRFFAIDHGDACL